MHPGGEKENEENIEGLRSFCSFDFFRRTKMANASLCTTASADSRKDTAANMDASKECSSVSLEANNSPTTEVLSLFFF